VKISETERKQVIEALVDEKKITPADTIKQVSISTPTVTEVKSEKPIDKPEEKSGTRQ